MDVFLLVTFISTMCFMLGFLMGMFLGDKYFVIDTNRKHQPIPEAKGELKDVDIIA